MKHQFNHRTQRNRSNTNSFRHSGTHLALSAILSVMTLGFVPYSFLKNLEVVGCNPFECLNRGQIRQMWFLQCMYR